MCISVSYDFFNLTEHCFYLLRLENPLRHERSKQINNGALSLSNVKSVP